MKIIFSLILSVTMFFCFVQPAYSQSSEELLEQLRESQTGGNNNPQNRNNSQPANQKNIFSKQSTGLGNSQQNATGLPQNAIYSNQVRSGTLLPGEANISRLLPLPEEGLAPPYGANIFAGGYETERADGLNDDYLVAPGDKISVWMWGSISYSDVTTVDNQGNIFIPNIGPIHVADLKASKVNQLVTAKIKNIYKKNVSVYVNLLTATPVAVYIAGSAIRPGQYAGMASDSILYFLKRAGGIDSERGSYRDIQIIRKGEVIQRIDLYQFIRFGQLPTINFKDNDVIFVAEQQSILNVTGGVKNPFRFEFTESEVVGQELISYVKPLSKTSHVAITGNRFDGPFSIYLSIDEFQNYQLMNGDKLFFNDDLHAQIYDIEIVGSYLGPSYFAVSKKTRLYDLLSHIEVEPELANFSSIYILRKSAALEQKEILNRSLDRLERSVLTSPTSSTGESKIRADEAKLVSEFIARARQTQPLGKVIVSDKGNIANIALEQGDKIVIPPKTDLVQIGGEVLMPQAVVFNPDASLEDYISWAGGYTNRANYEQVVVVHANGLTEFHELDSGSSWISQNTRTMLSPGDKLIVLPRVEVKTMQAVKDITQIIFQIAVAANAIK